jgi:hypothetical protein
MLGAFVGRKRPEDLADCRADAFDTDRAAALRNKCLSLAKTCSMGFMSGEYFGQKKSLAPAARIS